VTTAAITKTQFGNDWHAIDLDGSRALYNNQYSGRVYYSSENRNCQTGAAQSVLFYSTNYGQTFTKYTGSPQLPFMAGSYSMTASPSQREYIFGCPGGHPTLYVFAEATNQITYTWTDSATSCGSIAWNGGFTDGSPNVSFVSGESDGDFLRIAFPQMSGTRQTLHLTNLKITGSDTSIAVTKVGDRTIQASSSAGSVVQVSQIEPDGMNTPWNVPTNVTLLDWVETDGPLLTYDGMSVCQQPGSSGGLECAATGTKVTIKGMMMRDTNIWGPVFQVSETDANGAPLWWPNWHCKGDYRHGGFAYDPASAMLNFYTYWIGSDDATFHTNMISAHP
jgi:hypothetical protein